MKIAELLAEGSPTIRMQRVGKVKTSFSAGFLAEGDAAADLLSCHIRPLYLLGDGWIPLGLFAASNVTMDCIDGRRVMQVEALDLGGHVQRRTVEGTFTLHKGALYTEVVRALLRDCGIPRVRCRDSGLSLTSARADWEIGTSYIDIIDQLLTEINYEPLWFDAEGFARIEPPHDETDHVYRADAVSIIEPEYQMQSNYFDAANVFIALVSSPELEEPMRAVSVNEDPASPISTANRGRIPAPIMQLDNIASLEELQKYVDRVRDRSMVEKQQVTFTTAIQPHGVGDVILLDHHHMRGTYRETEWEITLGEGGSMTHTAEREGNAL